MKYENSTAFDRTSILSVEDALSLAKDRAKVHTMHVRTFELNGEDVASDAVLALFGTDWTRTVTSGDVDDAVIRAYGLTDDDWYRKVSRFDDPVGENGETIGGSLFAPDPVLTGERRDISGEKAVYGGTFAYSMLEGAGDFDTVTFTTTSGLTFEGEDAIAKARTGGAYIPTNTQRVGLAAALRGAANHEKAARRDRDLLEVAASKVRAPEAVKAMRDLGWTEKSEDAEIRELAIRTVQQWYTALSRARKRSSGLSGRVAYGDRYTERDLKRHRR